jgi:preprotein translocase subunit SecG
MYICFAGGGYMEIFLKVLLIIASLGLIAVVLLQKGKSAGLSGAITGGAEHLFGKQKARGLELFLSRLTIGLAIAFFILAIVVAYFVTNVRTPLDITTPPANTTTPPAGTTTPPANTPTPPANTTTPPAGTTTPPANATTPPATK